MEVPLLHALPAWQLALALLGCCLSFLVVAVLAVVLADSLRRRRHPDQFSNQASCLYSGRVWHTRYHPAKHTFSYPIFFAYLDLDEFPLVLPWYLWPLGTRLALPALVRFDARNHLKDLPTTSTSASAAPAADAAAVPSATSGATEAIAAPAAAADGATNGAAQEGRNAPASTAPAAQHSAPAAGAAAAAAMADRVRDFVASKCGTRPQGPVRLLTHLTYLGYCFNPVSFYYCYHAPRGRLVAIVAEVSNTPWLEMHCYVLAPGVQGVEVLPGQPRCQFKGEIQGETASSSGGGADESAGDWAVRYRFAKDFHVSPFMDMEHTYDWSFSVPRTTLHACTGMLKGDTLYFSARVTLPRRTPLTAASLLSHCVRYPAYTAAVQFLIHFEALRLWGKRVPFHPHPRGSETLASRVIAAVMAPLWALQARLAAGKQAKDKGA